ncbi:YwqG family protein [Corynebacterium hansenii]|uniref:YwqG family protein n=1 Tax=Corynebacterium hansenii TaxID=394964 RepID=A0ABV7ZQV3_9CORY|nr:YwqG family protein [Corynebacterium hansenii]WJZ01298.1 hypothetical protein CHAN_13595 [Corynebacterium hansenii]
MSRENEPSTMERIRVCREIVEEIQAENQEPACHLRFSGRSFGIADSHLGGIPYLPHGDKYPTGADGQMLWLCAQVNFAQMPRMGDFPDEGILQIFLSEFDHDGGFGLYAEDDGTVQGQWCVLYHPSVDETVTEDECLAKMPRAWDDDTEPWRTPDRPLKMEFLPIELEALSQSDFRFDPLFADALKSRLPDGDPEEYMPDGLADGMSDERELVDEIREKINIGGCKIGGYPRFAQDDPRPCGEGSGRPLTEWDTLLFLLDGDTFTFPLGDVDDMDISLNGATLNLFIRKEDLKNRDFSRVLAQWACS